MKASALNVIVCPACKNELTVVVQSTDAGEILEGTLTCIGCETTYPIIRGVPRFVPQVECSVLMRITNEQFFTKDAGLRYDYVEDLSMNKQAMRSWIGFNSCASPV